METTPYDAVINRLGAARDARRARLIRRFFSSKPGGFSRRMWQHAGRLRGWIAVEMRAEAARAWFVELAELERRAQLAAIAAASEMETY